MDPIRLFSLISWIALPTVMFGGYSLLGLLVRGNPWLTPFRTTYFRAGHDPGCAAAGLRRPAARLWPARGTSLLTVHRTCFLRRRFALHDDPHRSVRLIVRLSGTRCPGMTVETVQADLICKIPSKGRLWSTAPEQDDPV
jgi:hypothetical protein